MNVDEALIKAKELWGEQAHVRTLLGRTIDGGREGKLVSGSIRIWGFGKTWEEAFEDALKKT